jgi:hypothetical protein
MVPAASLRHSAGNSGFGAGWRRPVFYSEILSMLSILSKIPGVRVVRVVRGLKKSGGGGSGFGRPRRPQGSFLLNNV